MGVVIEGCLKAVSYTHLMCIRDRIYPTVRQRALSILRRLFIGMGLGAGCFIVLLLVFGHYSGTGIELSAGSTRRIQLSELWFPASTY